MADFSSNYTFDPNYVGQPNYISPEQLKNNRELGMALINRAGQGATRPAGVLAGAIDALTGNLTLQNATRMQQEAARQNEAVLAERFRQFQRGGARGVDPRLDAYIAANPSASPEARNMVQQPYLSERIEDPYHRPAYVAPGGPISPPPLNGAPNSFVPGSPYSQSAGDVSQSGMAPAAPIAPQLPPAPDGSYRMAGPQAMNAWRGNTAPPPGVPPIPAPKPPGAPPFASPSSGPNGAPNGPMSLDQLAAKGRELAFQRTQSGAVGDIAKQDVAAAADATTTKRIAGLMLDDLHAHGDQMTFGPTAEWSKKIKQVAANYAPGAMKNQLEAIASADSFDKLSNQLSSSLANSGRSDASLFHSMGSVPGSHNSKEGAEALLQMTIQVADQQQALREYASRARTPAEYEAFRRQYFQNNPITNPLTGNPIAQDIAAQKKASKGGARIISVE